MNKGKCFFVVLLSLFTSFVYAQQPLQNFPLLNSSRHIVYVWVKDESQVSIPGATQRPFLALEIMPGTRTQLNFTYEEWNKDTFLTVAFCSTEVENCVNTVGQYDSFTIVPNNPTQNNNWELRSLSSLMIRFPQGVSDNVRELNGTIWNRSLDFPLAIVFTNFPKMQKRNSSR